MAYYTAATTEFAVSATLPATFDDDGSTGYPGETYTEVGEITNIGEFGASFNLVTHLPIADRTVGKIKGAKNPGTLQLQMAADDDDAGQAILRDFADGANADDDVACRVTFSTGAIRYFTAKVMSFTESATGSDAILSATCNMEINRNIVKVSATS